MAQRDAEEPATLQDLNRYRCSQEALDDGALHLYSLCDVSLRLAPNRSDSLRIAQTRSDSLAHCTQSGLRGATFSHLIHVKRMDTRGGCVIIQNGW